MGFNSPQTQFSSRSRGMDRAPPHSISAISAHRSGGKKVPKKYRKYHKNHKKGKKEGGNVVSRVVHYVIKAIGQVMA